jgi:hypothetical protein
MVICPHCESANIHRSKTRSVFERVRRRLTHKRLHRCHDCGWRGWGEETIEMAKVARSPDESRDEDGVRPEELDALFPPRERRRLDEDPPDIV